MRYKIRKGKYSPYELVSIVPTNFRVDAVNFICGGTFEECEAVKNKLSAQVKEQAPLFQPRRKVMNIDDLTIAEAKALVAMFGGAAPLDTGMIGKYVIVRCRDAGVHAGVLESSNGRACVLTEARRLWYWKVRGSGDFLNAIALSGVHADSKLSAPVDRICLTENCEIIQCTEEAERVIRAQAVYNA
jgi:hypothetical protein